MIAERRYVSVHQMWKFPFCLYDMIRPRKAVLHIILPLAGNVTGRATDTLVQVNHHGKLSFLFHFSSQLRYYALVTFTRVTPP